MKFLNGCVTTVWQSLNDFPKARRQIHAFAGDKVTLIFIATFVPIVLMSLSLIITGSVCGSHADDGKIPNQNLISAASKFGNLINVGPEPLISSLTYFCSESPFSYITLGFFLPRRILTLMVLLCTGQLSIVIMNQFPHWAQSLRSRSKAPFVFDSLTVLMGVLTLVFICDAVYTLLMNIGFLKTVNMDEVVEELVKVGEGGGLDGEAIGKKLQAALDTVVDNAISTTFEERNSFFVPEPGTFEHLIMGGQILLLLWLLYIGLIALTLCAIEKPLLNSDNRLKHSFLVFVFAVFFAEMIHPDFGFIDAQIDLTLLTIAVPAMHVTLGMCVQNAMQSSKLIFFVGLPMSCALAGLSCFYSKAGGPGSFFIVTLHIFTKMLQFFGTSLDTKGLRNDTSSNLKSASVSELEQETDGEEKKPALNSRPSRTFTLFGIGGGGKGEEGEAEGGGSMGKKVSSVGNLRKAFSVIQEVEIDEDDELSSEEEEVDEFGKSLLSPSKFSPSPSKNRKKTKSKSTSPATTRSKRSNTALAKAMPKDLKASIIQKHKDKVEGKRAKSKSSVLKPKIMFNGFARFGTAFAVIITLAVGFIAVASFFQNNKQWYPELINIESNEETGSVSISHAYVAKIKLETKGEVKTAMPKYASCDLKFYGLSLLDYAFLAEAAYFDSDNSDLDAVVQMMFDPKGESSEKLFDVRVPPPEQRRQGVAQYMDAYSKSLNISVIAIRGTDVGRLSDLVEDVKIFKEPVLLSMLSVVFPTIRIWPDSVAAFVINALSQTLSIFGLEGNAQYYKGVLEYVRSIKDRQVVLTGHSLGGGLARIVAAIEHLPNVAFSPPGVAQSYYKFVYNEMETSAELADAAKLLHHESIAVLPENDPVPTVDTQVGLIQRIGCDVSAQAMQNSCHMLEGTISDLLKRCGDDRGRFTSSEFRFGLGDILRHMWAKSIEQKTSVMAGLGMFFIVVLLFVLPDKI
ncbi:hypothetical protein TL16_g03756 [Triparma laevis f. inornata]|uniref:Fungal lipase-type domain-containing protein n=1 Tax=Triparma laevis f. inornata TaxID=1714386 RepID=A0A9W7A648_9STRA|nr:hypothetical protein TL16_g03756 [Triparma laevis f. inornata]